MGPAPEPLDASSRSIRESVVLSCEVLEAHDQGDLVWGHVSARDPTGRGVWLKGAQLGFDEVTADDVILIDFDGQMLQGTAGRHVEYPIHTEIMRARPDVQSVVHTHPEHAIAFAATRRPLLPFSNDCSTFVPPDIARFTETSEFVSTAELGRVLAETIGDRNAALLPAHGIVTAAADLGRATTLAIRLERACRIALLAGEGAVGGDEEETLRKRASFARSLDGAWAYLARRVRRGALPPTTGG